MVQIKKVASKDDVIICSKAILEFRPNLNAETLVGQTLRMMDEGFKIAYIPTEDHSQAAAFVGYRSYEMYRTGKIIYIDDVFTSPECRGRGYAAALLKHIEAEALAAGIQSIHLDSGYALHPAHRLYLNQGYILPCHHFTKPLSSDHVQDQQNKQ
ncbi:GNAT family N-acetyltransferase [Mucilaginibacter aquatilis]|uniref:GNAT family N-acetyltransferase n=1 Tax=Mucilaginibacter aquatilis TaxID=1517760 RepID=A0A6I4I8I6_9SPHI|nr:GNAT family N-acetyltransferase [Mucilaginibacter aquatilis]MVN91441.1 GNAT family N-acetyltransferase [Mucilaginibacter aquatilis]